MITSFGGKHSKVITLSIVCGLLALGSWARQTHDAYPLKPPEPKYPWMASFFNLEGFCEVRFAVDEEGLPFSVMASCTLPVFCFEAKRSVVSVPFVPKTVNGVAQVRTNIVYPLTWAFHDSGYSPDNDPRPLEPCEPRAVS